MNSKSHFFFVKWINHNKYLNLKRFESGLISDSGRKIGESERKTRARAKIVSHEEA